MDIRFPYGPHRIAPQCQAPPIVIRHPHYPTYQSTLLRLPRLDVVKKSGQFDSNFAYGISHETALLACQIIAGNAQDAFLSYDRLGKQSVIMSSEGQSDNLPFPIICDFEDWQFPHGHLPEPWLLIEHELMENKSSMNCCLVSGNKGKPAFLVPQELFPWLQQNRMRDYVAFGDERVGYQSRANVCHLRADILEDFNHRAFALVPKMTSQGYRLIMNYFSAADDLSVPANVFHNRMVHPLGGARLEFLYARFAYAVFGLVEGFAKTTVRRVTIVEPGLDELGLRTWVSNVYWKFPNQIAARRANMANQIWEATWPDPRVIEIRSLPQVDSDDIYDLSRLQLYGTISNWLDKDDCDEDNDEEDDVEKGDAMSQVPNRGEKSNDGTSNGGSSLASGDSEDFDIEDARRFGRNPRTIFWRMSRENQHPIALSVCAESRQHTLRSFYYLRHHERSEWSFYLDPTQDVVWLSDSLWKDICFDNEDVVRLGRSYGSRLSHVEQVIVNAEKWRDLEELNILPYFGCLKTIKLLLDDNITPLEISTLLRDIELRFGNDDRFCPRFELVDRRYQVRGQVRVRDITSN
ncbi:hypothetical protein FOXG_14076 [Fusarium oxysporum f. sp. lycopersici 4287]|uniref:2EXR domain-containing protein n=2 Tax=Fusarium oxysporum TaxID=5507 RepID=A0A0J9VSD3_FUSO4|nr:hypothetical protein FOXG_12461 [Fusarium oxysporum f. sp. lycopersici 4287]XP_018253635.1 hypothetical protein FOXG_14076 [Fusarium oxysporum f. sp. lycopersici 4287]KNB13753.1 hypothetical protein FOXG_12461 [Fusarium oxysporum f. sp. lycopersici 4287]KNB15590.1 hypothetical protein FOXG_14076 [Fusarium oxysporum f. sp. lycopersici 4287]